MTQQQYDFFEWLLYCTHCIAVTARSSAELDLVNLKFRSWKVAAHGGVIIRPSGETDDVWQERMVSALAPYSEVLRAMQHFLVSLLSDRCKPHVADGASVSLCTQYQDVPVYLAVKFRKCFPAHDVKTLVDKVQAEFGKEDFQIHHNNNNLHWLPRCIGKGRAVEYLLEILRKEYGPVPVVGFADSVNDYGFLKHCSWLGFPRYSQLATVMQKVSGDKFIW
jgi:hypothetical protein